MAVNFGLGSGRCGTRSLATLFGWEHEPYSAYLLWGCGAEFTIEKLLFQGRSAVASAFLGYVPYILMRSPTSKFICLQRDKQETIESFLRQTEGYNPWDATSPSAWFESSRMHPKFFGLSKEEALDRYWDGYYALANHYEFHFKNFKVFPTKVLESEEGQNLLREFVGLGPKDFNDVRENVGSVPEPAYLKFMQGLDRRYGKAKAS